jgi:hypothetical protein
MISYTKDTSSEYVPSRLDLLALFDVVVPSFTNLCYNSCSATSVCYNCKKFRRSRSAHAMAVEYSSQIEAQQQQEHQTQGEEGSQHQDVSGYNEEFDEPNS